MNKGCGKVLLPWYTAAFRFITAAYKGRNRVHMHANEWMLYLDKSFIKHARNADIWKGGEGKGGGNKGRVKRWAVREELFTSALTQQALPLLLPCSATALKLNILYRGADLAESTTPVCLLLRFHCPLLHRVGVRNVITNYFFILHTFNLAKECVRISITNSFEKFATPVSQFSPSFTSHFFIAFECVWELSLLTFFSHTPNLTKECERTSITN